MSENKSIRHSVIAGSWYPGDAVVLKKQLSDFLSAVENGEEKQDVFALIVPHAGYIYSGKTAAHAFKLVEGQEFERVIITSPFHAPATEAFLTTTFEQYETPLGRITVDQEGLGQLNKYLSAHHVPMIESVRGEHEHSLEIELPFLQVALSESFEVVPVMVRTQKANWLKVLGEGLAELAHNRKTLLVASTDLSHFYEAKSAKLMDERVFQYIEAMSPMELLDGNKQGHAQACGAGAVVAVLWAAHAAGATEARVLYYSHSGMVTGDDSSVVGYGAAVILKGKKTD